MHIARFHTRPDADPFEGMALRVWRDENWLEYTVPAHWGQAAVEALVETVFYRDALPALTRAVEEDGMPAWLRRQTADDGSLDDISAEWRYRYERDARDVFSRIAGGLTYHGWRAGLFDTEEDAKAFRDEFCHMLAHQLAAPEPALLAAAGLDWAYGLKEAAVYTPAARIAGFAPEMFGQNLSGAGIVVSPETKQKNILKRLALLGRQQALDAADRADAGQAGRKTPPHENITVTLPVENIDSAGFAALYRQADIDAVAGCLGKKALQEALHQVMDACARGSVFGFDPDRNLKLARAIQSAQAAGVSEAALLMAVDYARQGYESVALETAAVEEDADMPAPGLSTVLSVPDDFIERALTGHGFLLTEGGAPARHCPADRLWDHIAEAVWSSGAPALFFRDSAAAASILQESSDSKESQSPQPAPGLSGLGGLVFLPGTEAPAATLNLAAFTAGARIVDCAGLVHAARLLTVALEASFAVARVTQKTRDYRPLAIGFCGMAPVLMGAALPYDSDAGRAAAALMTALVSGAAQAASADIAAGLGAFAAYPALEKACLQSLKDKAAAIAGTAYMQKGVTRRPAQLQAGLCPDAALAAAATAQWAAAYRAGKEKGFRHAHVTALDTGRVMQVLLSAPARDMAPESALVRFEGWFAETGEQASLYGKKINPAAIRALQRLKYTAAQIDDIHFYAVGHGTLLGAPCINHETLREKGFCRAALDAVEAALRSAQHIGYVFNKWTLGEDFCRHVLDIDGDDLEEGGFDMLAALGFSEDDIEAANIYCCGTMTLEGAPHLRVEHLPVFDCAGPSGQGVRRVGAAAEIRMQAALEPFLSGAIVHTVELDHYTDIEDVQKLLLQGWELGVKRLKLYRDGCGLFYPVAAARPLTAGLQEADQDPARPAEQKKQKVS
jgi:ribonucleoside-diphosphate reductase alpha chain